MIYIKYMNIKKSTQLVKQRLWQWGYSVQEVTMLPGIEYDLLVNKTVKVVVVDPSKETTKKGDVVAWVENNTVHYAHKDGRRGTSTNEIFGPKRP